MKVQNILFDLDGTLTDPRVGITRSVAYALERFGIYVEDTDALCSFIGPPLTDSFMEYYGFTAEQAQDAIGFYRERFSAKGLFENEVYPGIPETLGRLRDDGRRLIVATSKPAVFSAQILKHFGLDGYFSFLSGSELDGSRVRKCEVISHALEHCGITDPEGCIMVGDRKHDIIGAAETGMRSVGVLYGYGSREELEAAGASYIAADTGELTELLLRL